MGKKMPKKLDKSAVLGHQARLCKAFKLTSIGKIKDIGVAIAHVLTYVE